MIRQTLLSGCVLVLSACSTPQFNASVAKFGEATQVATSTQEERVKKFAERERQVILDDFAERHIVLGYSGGCAQLAIPGSNPKDCYVTVENGERLMQPDQFKGLQGLNKALTSYAKSLQALASDTSEDATAFNASLIELASSADSLTAAVENRAGPTKNAAQLNSVAKIGGAIANAVFGVQRASKLRAIIMEMDPVVQAAAAELNRASESLTLSEGAADFESLEQARAKLEGNIAKKAKTAVIAMDQIAFIEEVEKAKRGAQVGSTYSKIAKAHADLAAASRAGMSNNDIKASLLELLALAKVLKDESANL